MSGREFMQGFINVFFFLRRKIRKDVNEPLVHDHAPFDGYRIKISAIKIKANEIIEIMFFVSARMVFTNLSFRHLM